MIQEPYYSGTDSDFSEVPVDSDSFMVMATGLYTTV